MPTSGRSTDTDGTGDDVFMAIVREFRPADQRYAKMHDSGQKGAHLPNPFQAGTFPASASCWPSQGLEMIEIDMETTPSGAVRILVVEDEILIRLMIADALRDLGGALVISAATADEAWQYLVAEHDQVDVVFTDHRMPGALTGAQFAKKIADHYPNIPVIVTSAFYDGTEWQGPILPKPYDLESTVAMLIARTKHGRGES